MAGRPRRNALAGELEHRAAQVPLVEGEAACTPLEYVCLWLEGGQTLKALAADIEAVLHIEVSATFIERTLRRDEVNVDSAIEAARMRSSHSYAESAIALVDEPADTNVEVSRAASRARARQWLAEKYNPRAYGSSKDVSVSISIGSLHLAALQAVPTATASTRLLSMPSSDLLPDDVQVIE